MMFLIFFFLGSGMYVGGGVYYNTKTKGAVGMQSLPHLEFWSTMPGLVKDGLTFSVAKYNEHYGDGTPFVKPAAPLHGANDPGETAPVLLPEDAGADYGTAAVTPAASTPTKKKKKKKKPKTSSAGDETPRKEKKKRKKKPVEAIADAVEAKE